MNGFRKFSSLALAILLTLSALLIFTPAPVKASPTTVEVVNPVDGTHNFIFTSDVVSPGYEFIVNITVVDVTDLQNWQVRIGWDPELLEYVDIWLPSDHVFAGANRPMVTPPKLPQPGEITWGCTYVNDPYWTFNGTGTLCQLKLRIKKGVSAAGPTMVSCALQLLNPPADTFLLNGRGVDIEFSTVDGYYEYSWKTPPYLPEFYIKPSVCKPAKKGDVFALEVWVRNVHAGWEIIGFQFSLMWNTSFIEPALGPSGTYYDNGTFMEAFQYYPNGVLYAADINKHDRVPPLHPVPDDYNFSTFGIILLPDSPPASPYHAPFPSGEGKLLTVYFRAIMDTIAPEEAWTWIEFIMFQDATGTPEDTYALTWYMKILTVSTVPCHYRAPVRTLGLAIDLYTQYNSPYGGQGAHMPSDMFAPQQQVELYALVTYNEYPVQQKLVGFEIRHGDYVFWREATTNVDGIAHVSFRIPWPCTDPEEEIFGKWIVIATVEVAEQKVNDTLGFWVWWPVQVLSIEPKQTIYVQRKTGGDPLTFTVEYITYSMQEIPALITTTVYDELGFFIGSDKILVTVGWGEYKYYNFTACEEPPYISYTWDVSIPMPTNAVVGKGAAYANAFNDFPWNGGTPYCPEVKNTQDFYIAKPT